MTGIDTNNAKQMTECLEEIGKIMATDTDTVIIVIVILCSAGCLIAGYGTGVAGAKPSKVSRPDSSIIET